MRRKAAILPGINESRRIASFVDQMMPRSKFFYSLSYLGWMVLRKDARESSEDGRASLEMRQFFGGRVKGD